MVWAPRLWLKLQSLFRRNRSAQRLNAEIQFHLDQQIAENLAAGMSPEEARHAAMCTFGNPTFLKEETRDTWGWTRLEQLAQDLRYGFRSLRKSSLFTVDAVLTLAFGIGANTAIFSLMDQVLLELLPVKHPEQLVLVAERGIRFGGSWGGNESSTSRTFQGGARLCGLPFDSGCYIWGYIVWPRKSSPLSGESTFPLWPEGFALSDTAFALPLHRATRRA